MARQNVRLISLMGHSRPMHSAPAPINVRCYSECCKTRLLCTARPDLSIAEFGVVVLGPPFPPNSFAGHFVGPVNVNGPFTVTGTKGAAVPHPDGSTRVLFSLECPESWFEDFGKSQLSKGTTHITIDPAFAAVVDPNEYHVFLTPYGDCNGLYVDGLTKTGFTVREQKGGTSNVGFSYRLVF